MLGIAAVVEKVDEAPAGLVAEAQDDNSEKLLPFGYAGTVGGSGSSTAPKDETSNVTSACGYPAKKTTGYLKNCTQIQSGTGGTFLAESFNASFAVACAIPSRAVKMVYYDCPAELNFTADCSKSGTNNGIVTGCFVGPCIPLGGGRTLISYDCNV